MSVDLKQIGQFASGSSLEVAQWLTLCAEVRREFANLSEQQLADLLSSQAGLTAYQAEKVARGKAAELLLGNYIILDRLGQGGMGQVFKALHRRMKRMVAIKLPPTELHSYSLARFQHEVEAAGKLEHANIVTAYDADEADGKPFLVMQFIDGIDLAQLIRRHGPLSIADAVHCLTEVSDALAYAHGQGVIHRDIKPTNLILGVDGRVRILDMGLAWMLDNSSDVELDNANPEQLSGPAFMGNTDFLGPERMQQPGKADARSDLYGLGCTLFYLLTGRVPYPATTMEERIRAHQLKPIPNLRQSRQDVPPQLVCIFEKLLAKHPDDRLQSAQQLLAELNTCGVEFTPAYGELCFEVFGTHKPSPSSLSGQADTASGERLPQSNDATAPLVMGMGGSHMQSSAGTSRWPGKILVAAGVMGGLALFTVMMFLLRGPQSTSPGDPGHQAILYILKLGGTVQILEGDYWRTINQATELPEGELQVKSIQLGGNSSLDNQGLQQLTQLPEVEMLWLGKTAITDEGLMALRRFTQLRYLSLSGTMVTADSLKSLSQLRGLRVLRLGQTAVDDAGLVWLAKLTQLSELDLSHTFVSDAGLAHLSQLHDLDRLNIVGTNCTPEGVHQLKQALPRCEILVSLRETENSPSKIQ